ncbi:hypothetical protein FJZ31_19205 [Candidatus Poribacteria bacterium]|nr:hypothetical protein [Candidatus Poribacteria bacterium]
MNEKTFEPPYYNRGLFSEHYLLRLLPRHPVWQENIQHAFSQTLSLYQQKKEVLPTYSERQTEEEFIQPLFSILGFAYTPQVRFKRHELISIPDFALFTSEESKRDAELTRQSRDDFYETPFFNHVAALAEAKYWRRTLDTRASDKRDNPESRNRNPHFQITEYLTNSGCPRGILTNGTHWRLYFSGVESQEILYYEVELQRILEEESEDDFRYFYHFFNAAAFEPGAEGRTFLDEVFEQSRSYAKQVEERLKERIFEQVAPSLARGFFVYRREMLNISMETDESLQEIFNGTLLFLYRLIFLLYAEARELLPVTERQGYFAYSLTKLKGTIFDEQKTGRKFSDVSTSWYAYLKSLFTIVNRGDVSLNIPCYNGGLFAPDGLGDRFVQQAAKFLESHAIADSYLAEAIMLLTRDMDEKEADARFIDYRDLNVRHLGSIYEGLLEFKLKIAQQPLVKAREKGKDVYKPILDTGQIPPSPPLEKGGRGDFQAGDIYLTNDKSERKATGSYYTPDYIVRYIVENTVGPLIDGILDECQSAQEIRNDGRPLDEIFEVILSMRSGAAQSRHVSPAVHEAWKLTRNDDERRQFLLNLLDGVRPKHDYDAPTRILALKILDPAIGSGHFLVGTMDFLTRKLVALLGQFPNSPVLKEIEETRQKILAEAERRDTRIDAKMLTDENLLRRVVMKRCLYGVDLNPMAVELAKLSLWLHGFTVGAPLSFLDHHIKCGNSLIGSSDVKQSIIEATEKYQDFLRAVNNYFMVDSLADATYSEVEQSHKLHEEAKSWLEPTKERLNVDIAAHFIELSKQAVANAQRWAYFEKDERVAKDELDRTSLENFYRAQQIAAEKRFFHWLIEFPDVFFERQAGALHHDTAPIAERQNPGFDAVIGNPPYVMLQNLPDERELFNYTASVYRVAQYKIDTYHLFIESAFILVHVDGFFSYITPNTFLKNKFSRKLRELLLKENSLERIVLIPEQVFPEASVDTAVSVVKKGLRENHLVKFKNLDASLREIVHITEYDELPQSKFLASDELSIDLVPQSQLTNCFDKAFQDAVALKELGDAYFGIQTFDRKKFVSTMAKNADWKKTLDGTHINRYEILPANEYVYFAPEAIKSGGNATVYESPKIIVRQIGEFPIAAFDNTRYYCLNTTYNITLRESFESIKYVLSVINSTFISAYWRYKFFDYKETFPKIKKAPLLNIPIRRIFFTTPQDEREQQVAELKSFYESGDYNSILTCIDELLPKDADGSFPAFARSISVKDAIAKGYMTEQDAENSVLKEDSPSGYDENGNPLEKSDVVHDFLAFLAEQMTEMNKTRCEQIKRFWTDLEGITDADTFAKLQKGKQEKSLALKKPLHQFVNPESASNKRLEDALEWTEEAFKEFIKILAGRTPNLSDFLDLYRKYAPAVQTFAQRIQATDELIDGIVYLLYGLAEEEIAVVEGEK